MICDAKQSTGFYMIVLEFNGLWKYCISYFDIRRGCEGIAISIIDRLKQIINYLFLKASLLRIFSVKIQNS